MSRASSSAFISHFVLPWIRSDSRKPLTQQAKELVSLWRAYRLPPYHYLKHCLYNQGMPDVMGYIPPELIRRLQIHLNPPTAVRALSDKLETTKRLASDGIPCLNEVLSIDKDGAISSSDGKLLGLQEAVDLANGAGCDLFLKPVWGGVGRGAIVVQEGKLAAELLARLRWYLIQPFFSNHPDISVLHPSSLNTVRLDTLHDGQVVHVTGACLKVGTGGEKADNFASGSIAIGIDLGTGCLSEAGFRKAKFGRGPYLKHPDTGVEFAGLQLPFWTETLSIAKRAAIALRPNRSIGWDIAITPSGPVIVEGNETGDVFLLQEACGPLGQTELGRLALAQHLSGEWTAGWGDPQAHIRLTAPSSVHAGGTKCGHP